MKLLGVSAYYHDSAACLIIDGKILSAVQEERFSRIKNDASFPTESIKHCLKSQNISIDDLDAIVYYEKPFLKFERLLTTYFNHAPKGLISFINAMSLWLKSKLFIKTNIRKALADIQPFDSNKLKILFSEHHLSHAASTYYPSGYQEAAILTMDGVGEYATCSIMHGQGTNIKPLKEMQYPNSIGLLYSSFTYFLGFEVNSGEYKMMGLAPYGNEEESMTKTYVDLIKNELVNIFEDGSIHLKPSFFKYSTSLKMISNKRWEKLFKIQRRKPNSKIKQEHCNLAFAIQKVTEEIILKLARHAKSLTASSNLCLSGGVALNCVTNGKIVKEKIFDNVFIQPAAGDAGGALGAALAVQYMYSPLESVVTNSNIVYLGPKFSNDEIKDCLERLNLTFTEHIDFNKIVLLTANKLYENKVVGWFQDSLEFGPRALGNRSILANPLTHKNQSIVNQKIKFRESFRPFAPILMEELLSEYFDSDYISPYMLSTAKVSDKFSLTPSDSFMSSVWSDKLEVAQSQFPAVTHVDKSSRIQTVNVTQNQKIYNLLKEFKKLSGYGMLINTSFNMKDEPIVCSPEEAINCFLNTNMDTLVLGNIIVNK